MLPPSIFTYIKGEEAKFQTEEVRVGDNWNWSFRNHVQLIFHLRNGVFYTGENNWLRAFKNIMEPLLNLAYWTEDIEVKDVVFFIEEKNGRELSFLIKKYHDEVYVKENDLDMMFDEITESDIDYGGSLVQITSDPKPEVIPLQSIAFCDQTDILGSPIAFKHSFSPEKLREMSKLGWGEEKNGATISIEDLIVLVTSDKNVDTNTMKRSSQARKNTIDTYIVRGNLPEHYLNDNDNMEYFFNQIQIVAFYTDEKGNREGVILYRKKEDEGNLMFHTSKKVYGRALGRGTGEALLHPQIWENFLTIHKMNMLEAGSKVPLYTDDESYKTKNKIQDMENLEITTIEDGKRIFQVPTVAPANVQLLEKGINDWYEHAQLSASAYDPQLGKDAVSGTTFRGQNQLVQQGRGSHDRHRGQRAKFIEQIYRKAIIPKIKKGILNGKKFLATLSLEEMTYVVDNVTEKAFQQYIIDLVLAGQNVPDEQTLQIMKDKFKQDFRKKGNKHLLEILKGEFDDIEIKIGINVASKQKNLAGLSDKLLSIIQFAFSNPPAFQQTMQIPGMSKAFSDIMEASGLSPVDFSMVANMPAPQALPSPIQQSQLAQPTNVG